MTITITEVKDREVLGEGRSCGMGFGFLKKINKTTFETVQPLSPCKDYLNEVVFTENTGQGSSAFGLSYPKKNDIFEDVCYLGIKILPQKNNTYYYSKSIDTDKAHLKANYKNITSLLNSYEEKLEMKKRTVIKEAKNDYFLVIVPREWTVSSYAISLYTLLLRCALVYDGKSTPEEFIKTYKYHSGDQGLLKMAQPKIEKILANKKLPTQVGYKAENKNYCPHNYGIIGWNSNFE